jgi:hypothetical protein
MKAQAKEEKLRRQIGRYPAVQFKMFGCSLFGFDYHCQNSAVSSVSLFSKCMLVWYNQTILIWQLILYGHLSTLYAFFDGAGGGGD